MKKVFSFILIILLFTACSDNSTGNDDKNRDPEILSLASNPDTIETGEISVLTSNANDPDGDELTFVWESDSGSINGSGNSVNWLAPNVVGTYIVKCKVLDGNGGQDIDSVDIVVEQKIPTEGLVAYYPFNGNANDESLSNFTGTVNGATLTIDRFGNSNNAYAFDGINDYIYSDFFRYKNFIGMTVQFWLKSTSTNECMLVQSGHFFSYLGAFSVGKFLAGFDGSSSNNTLSHVCTTSINDGTWHCLVAIYNNNITKLYVDGSLESSYADTIIPESYGFLHFGSNGGNQSFFGGLLDDIRIYDRALSLEEIQILYHEGGWYK